MNTEIVVGIDVSKNFSNFCILGPDNNKFKEFKAKHQLADLQNAVKKMKEAETQYNTKCVLVMEATGHYSRLPFHFFHQSNFKVCLVNPIQTNSIKNISIRKVKTDKVDAYKIAILYRLGELKPVNPPKEEVAEINLLCRQYFKLTDDIVAYKNHLIALLDQTFPGYTKAFNDITSVSSWYILKNFTTPKNFLKAPKDEVILNLTKLSKSGFKWASKKYHELLDIAKSAVKLACAPKSAAIAINTDISILESLVEQKNEIEKEIIKISNKIPEVKLIRSLPGVSYISAATFISEVRDIKNFKNPRKLIAFCGIDSTVYQSGKFRGSNTKISKRGSKFLRRILFTMVLTLIRKTKKGRYLIPYFAEYYQKKIETKPKKVAIVAAMSKLIKYIFAILRDQKPFELVDPKEHINKYKNILKAA